MEQTIPLHAAIRSHMGFLGVQKLLNQCAEPSIVDKFHKTALHHAVESGSSIKIIRALLNTGVDVNIKDLSKATVLYSAVERGVGLDVIKALILAGGNVNCDVNKTTLLHIARTPDVLEFLVSLDLNVNAINYQNRNPLHYTLSRPSQNVLNLVDILLKNNVSVNATDHLGYTPLHLALMNISQDKDRFLIVKKLLRKRCNVNARDKSGRSPLYHLMEYPDSMDKCYENLELVRILLFFGCDINLICGCYTPLSILLASYNKFWVKHLLKMSLLINFNLNYYSSLVSDYADLVEFLHDCVIEVNHMKNHKISFSNYTLFELIMSDHLNKYPHTVFMEDLSVLYPIYYNIVSVKIEYCAERTVLKNKMKNLNLSILNGENKIILSYLCLKNIAEHLSNHDLKNFLIAIS